jgi:mono/diheme cytochrome c family protein
MKCALALIGVWITLHVAVPHVVASASAAQAPASTPTTTPTNQALLKRYCVSCHNEKQRAAGLSPMALDTLDVNRVGADAPIWEKVVTKLRTASMPPPGVPRPDAATYDALSTWIETELDRAAAAHPNPGQYPRLHRLNRAEYQNAVRDLLALDHLPKELDISTLLPPDDVSYGFDNIAAALATSPTLLESYLTAAQKISALAVGDPSMPVIVDTYRIPLQLPQEDTFEGLHSGAWRHQHSRWFPLDGESAFRSRSVEPHARSAPAGGCDRR